MPLIWNLLSVSRNWYLVLIFLLIFTKGSFFIILFGCILSIPMSEWDEDRTNLTADEFIELYLTFYKVTTEDMEKIFTEERRVSGIIADDFLTRDGHREEYEKDLALWNSIKDLPDVEFKADEFTPLIWMDWLAMDDTEYQHLDAHYLMEIISAAILDWQIETYGATPFKDFYPKSLDYYYKWYLARNAISIDDSLSISPYDDYMNEWLNPYDNFNRLLKENKQCKLDFFLSRNDKKLYKKLENKLLLDVFVQKHIYHWLNATTCFTISKSALTYPKNDLIYEDISLKKLLVENAKSQKRFKFKQGV